MDAGNLRAPPGADWVDTQPLQADAAPRLWNPAAAGCWSLLFTPVFHMKNWRALGNEEKAGQAKMWMIASLAILAGVVVASLVLPESKQLDQVARSVNIGLLMAWYVTSAREQQKLVKERFGKAYERRGWFKPIGLALLAVFGLFCVLLVVELVAGA
jgi:hypothetical protein